MMLNNADLIQAFHGTTVLRAVEIAQNGYKGGRSPDQVGKILANAFGRSFPLVYTSAVERPTQKSLKKTQDEAKVKKADNVAGDGIGPGILPDTSSGPRKSGWNLAFRCASNYACSHVHDETEGYDGDTKYAVVNGCVSYGPKGSKASYRVGTKVTNDDAPALTAVILNLVDQRRAVITKNKGPNRQHAFFAEDVRPVAIFFLKAVVPPGGTLELENVRQKERLPLGARLSNRCAYEAIWHRFKKAEAAGTLGDTGSEFARILPDEFVTRVKAGQARQSAADNKKDLE